MVSGNTFSMCNVVMISSVHTIQSAIVNVIPAFYITLYFDPHFFRTAEGRVVTRYVFSSLIPFLYANF